MADVLTQKREKSFLRATAAYRWQLIFFFGFKNALPWPVNMLKVGINVHASVTDKLSVKFLFGFF